MPGLRLLVFFEDGFRVADLSRLRAGNEDSDRLVDPEYFGRVRVDENTGAVVWPDGFELAPEALYRESQLAGIVPHGPFRGLDWTELAEAFGLVPLDALSSDEEPGEDLCLTETEENWLAEAIGVLLGAWGTDGWDDRVREVRAFLLALAEKEEAICREMEEGPDCCGDTCPGRGRAVVWRALAAPELIDVDVARLVPPLLRDLWT